MQSGSQEAVEMVWARDADPIGVMLAVAQILGHNAEPVAGVKTLAITIEL